MIGFHSNAVGIDSGNRVIVVQRRLTHYRVELFNQLRHLLYARGIYFDLAYGTGTHEEQEKGDSAEIDWGIHLDTHYLLDGKICYQPLKSICNQRDLIIVTQENKLICNLWHQFLRTPYKIGLWGHGGNLQGQQKSLRERYKAITSRRADWWFGYTNISQALISQTGFPSERITILNNAVDTSTMHDIFRSLTANEIAEWRKRIGITGNSVGIFLGSLYAEKRLDFLLTCALSIRCSIPDFQLIIVGAGNQSAFVEAFCEKHSWAHFLGMLKGKDKVMALASSSVMLNPGLVGLGILDSFCCQTPIVTTDCGIHSPEIAYLHNGFNGLMTQNTPDAFTEGVVRVLTNSDDRSRMKAACSSSAEMYSLSRMVENFAIGIELCLRTPPYRYTIAE